MTLPPSAKPRVLLVDDHVAFLDFVTGLLAGTFDVVGRAGDGRQALDLASCLRPDVVVLDVAMPGLNGFQTFTQLRRDCPGTRGVFLTNHHDEEFVAAAINAGAHGYVLKSRLHAHLISAIEHALGDRVLVPSLTSLTRVAGGQHAVHLHTSEDTFVDDVSPLVGQLLRAGEQVVLVASEAIRSGVAQRLRARQMNLTGLAERGQYIEQDPALALSQVMRDGRPDRARLVAFVDGLERLRTGAPDGPRDRLTIVGGLPLSVCDSGNFAAALEVERLWNDATRALPLLTICSYPTECFDHPDTRDRLARMCAEHSVVTSGTSRADQHQLKGAP